jgi:predicted GNAT family N-acyltransferase
VKTTARIAAPDELSECHRIRRVVFIEEQQVPKDLEIDGLDPSCVHFLAEVDHEPAGTARLRITEDHHAKAERVAVLRGHRRHGVGAALMTALEAEAKRMGHHEVLLSAQVEAIPFYLARGYETYGPEFMDAGIPHRKMRLPL